MPSQVFPSKRTPCKKHKFKTHRDSEYSVWTAGFGRYAVACTITLCYKCGLIKKSVLTKKLVEEVEM